MSVPEQIEIEESREAGAVYVAHQMWRRLRLDAILRQAGLNERARLLSEVMTINRLVAPASEHAMPDWVRRTALADLLRTDFTSLNDDALYRNLDRLHPQRVLIEGELAGRERELFQLAESIYLYDLTSTYFEGQALRNAKAKRGHSRDKRPDCKQVVVGLVVDGDGFPKAHEVFEGNRNDSTTVEEMLAALEKRVGKKAGTTVTVDRGMAYEKNIEQIRSRGYHYLVAARPEERWQHELEFAEETGWEEVVRQPSPTNPFQEKTRVWIKPCVAGQEVHLLCVSEQRQEKDRAIRELQQKRLLVALERLSRRIAKRKKKPLTEAEVHQAIGRLRERYSRVGRYYRVLYDAERRALSWQEEAEKKRRAERLDGSYVLKTDRRDMTPEEIWRSYILLTCVEFAFRAMKSPLMERPIFHHLVAPGRDAHLPVCAGLSSAGHRREGVSGSGHPHLLGVAAETARQPPGGHRGAADQRRPADPHPKGGHAGSRSTEGSTKCWGFPRRLSSRCDSRNIVTERPCKSLISRDRALNSAEVGLTG